MSDYGLRVKDAVGNTILSITDKITRLMWKSSHTSSADNSGELSQIDGILTGNFAVPVNADVSKTAHIVSRSGNVISWTTFSYTIHLSPADCVIFCFAYT